MADNKIVKAQTKRTTYLKQMIRIKEFVNSKMNTARVAEAELRLSALNTCFENFEKVQSQLEDLDITELDSNSRAEVEEYYFTLQPMLTTFIKNATPQSSSSNDTSTASVPPSNVRLPQVLLPTFAGEYTNWLTFFETFTNLVHENSSLDNISRFHYLRSSLTGLALKRIESLDVTADNYEVALSLLKSRYDRKVIIIQEHIKKLFNLPNASRGIASSLRNLIDTVQSHLRALNSLGRPVIHWDDIIIHILSSKIDNLTMERWNEQCQVDKMPTLDQFINFLEKRCHQLEGPSHYKSPDSLNAVNNKRENKSTVQKSSFTTTKTSKTCSCCNNATHAIFQCETFKKLSPQNRYNFIKQKKLCINCLRPGHNASSCNSAHKCHTCSAAHHTLLHFVQSTVSKPVIQGQESSTSNAAVSYHSSKNIVKHSSQNSSSYVFLATALVHVFNTKGEAIVCRAMLDSGSQLHFLSKRLAIELGIKTTRVHIPIGGIGNVSTTVQSKAVISMKSLSTTFEIHNMEVHILPNISESQPDRNIDVRNWKIPTNIRLADPDFNTPHKIDLLIGAELYCKLLDQGKIQINPELPILQNTRLGWIITGRASIEHTPKYQCNVATRPSISYLENLVQQFWEIERHDTPSKSTTIEEQQAEAHFLSTHKRLSSGQFVVRLPFRNDPAQLGDSMSTAHKRILSLERKLSRDSNLKKSYSDFINEYLHLNHMTELSITPQPNFVFPHHCVIKPDSSTTKLRVVFDVSARSSSGKSLNDILMTGPTVQPELFAIILRFRLHRYVFTADISKMYRQILVDPADRNYQLVLWRNNPDEQLKTFQLNIWHISCSIPGNTMSQSISV